MIVMDMMVASVKLLPFFSSFKKRENMKGLYKNIVL